MQIVGKQEYTYVCMYVSDKIDTKGDVQLILKLKNSNGSK